MSELKPCPFCGSADIRTEPGINLNYCDKCSAEANIEHWNTRPIEDALNARIAELELRLDVYNGNMYDVVVDENAKLEAQVVIANKRIAELEAENERFTVHSDIERQDDKSPNHTQIDTVVY